MVRKSLMLRGAPEGQPLRSARFARSAKGIPSLQRTHHLDCARSKKCIVLFDRPQIAALGWVRRCFAGAPAHEFNTVKIVLRRDKAQN